MTCHSESNNMTCHSESNNITCHSERSEESVLSRRREFFFIPVVFCLILNSSCAPNTLEKEAPAVNEIKAGEKFTIILPENHDQGLLWKLKDDINRSVIDNIGAVWHGNDKGINFRFEALKSGTDTLRFTQFKTDAVTKERDSVKTAIYIVKVVD